MIMGAGAGLNYLSGRREDLRNSPALPGVAERSMLGMLMPLLMNAQSSPPPVNQDRRLLPAMSAKAPQQQQRLSQEEGAKLPLMAPAEGPGNVGTIPVVDPEMLTHFNRINRVLGGIPIPPSQYQNTSGWGVLGSYAPGGGGIGRIDIAEDLRGSDRAVTTMAHELQHHLDDVAKAPLDTGGKYRGRVPEVRARLGAMMFHAMERAGVEKLNDLPAAKRREKQVEVFLADSTLQNEIRADDDVHDFMRKQMPDLLPPSMREEETVLDPYLAALLRRAQR